jgi:hypothetical protein
MAITRAQYQHTSHTSSLCQTLYLGQYLQPALTSIMISSPPNNSYIPPTNMRSETILFIAASALAHPAPSHAHQSPSIAGVRTPKNANNPNLLGRENPQSAKATSIKRKFEHQHQHHARVPTDPTKKKPHLGIDGRVVVSAEPGYIAVQRNVFRRVGDGDMSLFDSLDARCECMPDTNAKRQLVNGGEASAAWCPYGTKKCSLCVIL